MDPSLSVATILATAEPMSFPFGVPDKVRALLSRTSHLGASTSPYVMTPTVEVKVDSENVKVYGPFARATGGTCALMRRLAIGLAAINEPVVHKRPKSCIASVLAFLISSTQFAKPAMTEHGGPVAWPGPSACHEEEQNQEKARASLKGKIHLVWNASVVISVWNLAITRTRSFTIAGQPLDFVHIPEIDVILS